MNEYVPGLEGVPATKSNISFIDGEKGILSYRGYPIEMLAERSTFEETALLLLDGDLPTRAKLKAFDQDMRANRQVKFRIRELMRQLPPAGHPMDMLQSMMACLGMDHSGAECLTGGDHCNDVNFVHNTSVTIIAHMATMVTMWEHIRNGYDPIEPRTDLTHAENFLWMLTGKEPDRYIARIMDICLILHAEHTINASTFAVLVAGSTLASPYSVIASGIATLSGPLHGGANQAVVHMLEEIGTPEKAAAYIDAQLKAKKKIWGFGHREYNVKDPRAVILEHLMRKFADYKEGKVGPLFEIAQAVEKAATDRLGAKGIYPNVDFYSGVLYREMGIAPDQFPSLFAMSRVAGWLAHWKEQLGQNRIFRPTQVYTGEVDREYVPLERRG
ncbi:MAG: citrate synthase [Burkholderiales bacterium]|nr:citrate synthase [Burkholderiales bacterium]